MPAQTGGYPLDHTPCPRGHQGLVSLEAARGGELILPQAAAPEPCEGNGCNGGKGTQSPVATAGAQI